MISEDLLRGHEKNKRKKKDLVQMEGSDEEDHTKRKMANHRRGPKKPVDSQKANLAILQNYFSVKQMNNGDFMKMHRRAAVFAKAGVCPLGGFGKFKKKLVELEMPNCEVCQAWLKKEGITLDLIKQLLEDGQAWDSLVEKPDVGEAEELVDDDILTSAEKRPADDKASRAKRREECLAFVKSVPHIEAIDGQVLKYRCTICFTKKQPEGKTNILGRDPTMTQTKTFIDEHLTSQSHMKALAKLNLTGQTEKDLDCEEQPTCSGYNVSNHDSTGTLHYYAAEFGIWATHTKLSGKACHSYVQHATDGEWYIRHKDCSGHRPTDAMCCKLCATLGEPRAVQRQVVSFTRNYCAAQLLSKKLYFSPNEVQAYIQEVDASAFGKFNVQIWSGLKDLNLVQLQAFVVNTYKGFPDHLKTPNLKHFLQTVVDPSVKVNVTGIDEGLAPLTAQFVQALANRRLNDAWLIGTLTSVEFVSDAFQKIPENFTLASDF